MNFNPFPKIPRLSRECVITEKIDGTNASILIADVSEGLGDYDLNLAVSQSPCGLTLMFAGSRTRWITPKDDNAGFATWVKANAEELFKLGVGHHFGEWWGSKIGRTYGLTNGERRFSLFNTSRWADPTPRPACVGVVPELYRGPFSTNAVESVMDYLREHGSVAQPGFMDPEGIIIFHAAANQMFKKTLKDDEKPKGSKEIG
jgi:hypothetical protein